MTKLAYWAAALGVSVLLTGGANAQSMTLTSPDIAEGATIGNEQVFKGFGCTGGNVSPALNWSGAPAGAKSFAVTMYDPDAPTGSGWWHWVVFNIPAGTSALPKGAGDVKKKLMPKGAIQSRTDFGADGYGGPCPPPGKSHRYYFKLYALDAALLLKPRATKQELLRAMDGHILAEARLSGTYQRKR